MYTKRGSIRPSRYDYIIVMLLIILMIAGATVMMYPIEVIANLVSTCVQITIIAIVMIIAVLVLFVFLFFVPQLVTPSITQYLIEMGQFYGVPILAFAMLSAMFVFLRLFNLVQKNNARR